LPLKCSVMIPMNLSREPYIVLCNIIGLFIFPFSSVYSSSNLSGSAMSSWIVEHCQVLFSESLIWKSIFGP